MASAENHRGRKNDAGVITYGRKRTRAQVLNDLSPPPASISPVVSKRQKHKLEVFRDEEDGQETPRPHASKKPRRTGTNAVIAATTGTNHPDTDVLSLFPSQKLLSSPVMAPSDQIMFASSPARLLQTMAPSPLMANNPTPFNAVFASASKPMFSPILASPFHARPPLSPSKTNQSQSATNRQSKHRPPPIIRRSAFSRRTSDAGPKTKTKPSAHTGFLRRPSGSHALHTKTATNWITSNWAPGLSPARFEEVDAGRSLFFHNSPQASSTPHKKRKLNAHQEEADDLEMDRTMDFLLPTADDQLLSNPTTPPRTPERKVSCSNLKGLETNAERIPADERSSRSLVSTLPQLDSVQDGTKTPKARPKPKPRRVLALDSSASTNLPVNDTPVLAASPLPQLHHVFGRISLSDDSGSQLLTSTPKPGYTEAEMVASDDPAGKPNQPIDHTTADILPGEDIDPTNSTSSSGSAMDITDNFSEPVVLENRGPTATNSFIKPEHRQPNHTSSRAPLKRSQKTTRAAADVMAPKGSSRSSAVPESKPVKSRRSVPPSRNLTAPSTLRGGIDSSPVKVPSDDSDDDELLLKPRRMR